MLEKSDWLAIVSGVVFFGGGLYMSTLTQRIIRIIGISVTAIGIVGLAAWFGYYRYLVVDPMSQIRLLGPMPVTSATRNIEPSQNCTITVGVNNGTQVQNCGN